jgi:hypothetical protein
MSRLGGKVYEHAGVTYRSKFEVEIAKQLIEAGIKFEYEQWKLSYLTNVSNAECGECTSCNIIQFHEYTPDFWICDTMVALEAKGRFTARDRKKMVAVQDANPGIDFRMVFQRNQKVTRNRPKVYSEWCEEKGFKWTEKIIPDEWLAEFSKAQERMEE